MNPYDIIKKYYKPGSVSYDILVAHSEAVAEKAVRIADGMDDPGIDRAFVYSAAMLHDIGIFYTNVPEIGCFGENPYVCHGYLGRRLLAACGLEKQAGVAERHVGAGLTAGEITAKKLPVPVRDMLPETTEEQIICVADKFFSKHPGTPGNHKELDLPTVMAKVKTYGDDSAARFESWLRRLGMLC